MTLAIRTFLLLGISLLPLVAAGQERTAASASIDKLTPFLDSQTVAIAHLDFAKVDVKAAIDFVTKAIPADVIPAQQRDEVLKKGTEIREQILATGISEIYLIVSLADLPQAEPFAVFPLGKNAKPEVFQELIKSLGHRTGSEVMNGAVVVGLEDTLARVKASPGVARPDLAKALAAAGNSAAQLVVSPSDDTRRGLRESLPALPAELGGLSGAELADGFGWLAASVNLPPKPSLEVTLQAKDARAAEQLRGLAAAALDLLAKNEDNQRQLPGIDKLLELLRPQVRGDRLVLKLDEQQGNLTRIMDELVKPAIVSARAAATRMQSANNLKQLMIGLHTHHDNFRTFPPQAIRKEDKKLLSWRVQLLPFLEQKELYDQFHLDEPWDSDHNKKLIEKMPQVFAGQGLTGEQVKEGLTNYLAPVGPKTVFEGSDGRGLAEITDGTSNTIALVEVAPEHAVAWTKPDDWMVDFSKPFAGLLPKEKKDDDKPEPIGFHAAFCDGSVRLLSTSIGWESMRKLLQRDDGEVIGEF